MAGGGVGPVSRQFLWKCAKMTKDIGVNHWVPKFWEAIRAGKTVEAANFYKTICTVIRNNAGKNFAIEMEALLPEMGEALTALGVDMSTLGVEILAEEIAIGTTLSPVCIAIIAAVILGYFLLTPAHGEELPRKVPPPLKGNNNADPVSAAQRQLTMEQITRRILKEHRPQNIGL